jgi:hypothetical protein
MAESILNGTGNIKCLRRRQITLAWIVPETLCKLIPAILPEGGLYGRTEITGGLHGGQLPVNKAHMCHAPSLKVDAMGNHHADTSDGTCCSTFINRHD